MVDSGAMHHMTPYCSNFDQWTLAKGSISLGGHAEIEQISSGSVTVKPAGLDWNMQLTLQNVMHVPEVQARYLSVSTLLQKGGQIVFRDMGFDIFINNQKIAHGYLKDNLF